MACVLISSLLSTATHGRSPSSRLPTLPSPGSCSSLRNSEISVHIQHAHCLCSGTRTPPLAQRRLGPCPHTVLHRTLLERSSNTLLSSARNKAIPRAHSLAISLPPRRSSHASTPPTKRNNTMNALRAVLMPLNSEATWGGKRVRSACAVRMKVGRCERHASMT